MASAIHHAEVHAMKTNGARSGKKLAPKKGIVLPDDACPTCGTMMRERRALLRTSVNGEDVSVPDVSHLRCPKCGEVVLQVRHLNQSALDRYRRKYGLLASGEIRSLRQRLGLTQVEFGRLVRLGSNTISRWESGRNVQTAAMDVLLRLVRDLPGSLDYLRDHAA